MEKELVIGFDCRAMWLSRSELWPHIQWHELLKTDIENWLSIERLVWPTVFLFHQVRVNGWIVGTAPDCNLEIPYEHRTQDSFWDDLDAMQSFLEENKQAFQRPSWMIALTVVPTANYLKALSEDIPWSRTSEILDGINLQEDWIRLGYDVQTDGPSFGEGLGDVYPDIKDEMKERWRKHLNKYHLFDDCERAIEYADWQYNYEPMLGIQFVYGIYLIGSFP
jgi:hypothetical protein